MDALNNYHTIGDIAMRAIIKLDGCICIHNKPWIVDKLCVILYREITGEPRGTPRGQPRGTPRLLKPPRSDIPSIDVTLLDILIKMLSIIQYVLYQSKPVLEILSCVNISIINTELFTSEKRCV